MMKFNKLKYNLKKNKLFLSMFIVFCAVILFDFVVCVFDIVSLIVVGFNSANLSNAFLTINIIMIILNVVFVVLVFIYPILDRRLGGRKNAKK